MITREEVKLMTRSSRDDALSNNQFDALWDACKWIDNPLEGQFLLRTLGWPCAMRGGEVLHLRPSWIDYNRGVITIPGHEPCDCSYCRKRARMKRGPYEKALKRQWEPKTKAGARGIPFWHVDGTGKILKEFMSEYGGWPYSETTMRCQVKELGDLAGLKVYRHALRATAAMKYAYTGIGIFSLMAIMGWSNMQVALDYIRASGAMANAELEKHYERESNKRWRGFGRVLHTPEKRKKLLTMRQRTN